MCVSVVLVEMPEKPGVGSGVNVVGVSVVLVEMLEKPGVGGGVNVVCVCVGGRNAGEAGCRRWSERWRWRRCLTDEESLPGDSCPMVCQLHRHRQSLCPACHEVQVSADRHSLKLTISSLLFAYSAMTHTC